MYSGDDFYDADVPKGGTMTKITLPDLIADATVDGSVGLLAYELARNDRRGDRTRGPLDGRCEVCGEPGESFVLFDWLRWHCTPCADAAFRGDAA